MSEQHYYSIVLRLPKEFMVWVHDHPTVALFQGSSAFGWANHPDIIQHNFGGKYGTQFTTTDGVKVFLTKFREVLQQWNIPNQHLDPLLYIYCFVADDVEKQSIANNRYNELCEYAKYLSDLYAIGIAHINKMSKDQSYALIHDKNSDEVFFAKKELSEKYSLEEILEYYPDEKHANDVIRYMVIKSHGQELYIPRDLDFNINSLTSFKNYLGESLIDTNIKKGKKVVNSQPRYILPTPPQIKRHLFESTINYMLNEHKRDNTDFYKAFTNENSLLSDFKSFYNRNQRHIISNTLTLTQIGTLVTAYLNNHKLINSKRQQAYFLHEYFVLLKAFDIKNKELPSDYEDLKHFYISNKITQEFVRNMMKDVGEI
ncbi:hypothetical protein LJ707_16260 [Mucilaginibacter sp. UR6-1]|uniref:hypothetical protein n=1 Tax=Mucilaginibacter sp. UR6-1 TaxID=1435643 RepID=UPI001E52BD11|nr:hypothetical protein [Mucilaginibacter sp. UR6-1]MCC8410497.1 hypothetical protein [Mucilaginibacter sp. UR6-1]